MQKESSKSDDMFFVTFLCLIIGRYVNDMRQSVSEVMRLTTNNIKMLYIINYVCKFAAKLNVYMFNLNYIVMKEFTFLDEVVLGESEMLEIHGGASDTVTCGSNCGHR